MKLTLKKVFFLLIFLAFSQTINAEEEEKCENPKGFKEKISCKFSGVKKKHGEIKQKKTLSEYFKKKD